MKPGVYRFVETPAKAFLAVASGPISGQGPTKGFLFRAGDLHLVDLESMATELMEGSDSACGSALGPDPTS